jgi:hypothetical protein
VKIPASSKEIVFQEEDDGYDGKPKEVSFTEYSLAGTSCQWVNLEYDNSVIVISSKSELENYISCAEKDFPAVDFSKYTLLLAHGLATSSVVSVNCNRLQQLSGHSYTMSVDIVLGNATVISRWQVPVIVDKWSGGCAVGVTVTVKQG